MRVWRIAIASRVNLSLSELDIEDTPALAGYLRQRGLLRDAETPVIRNLEGGVSNRVVLVKPEAGKPLVLKQALAKLRVQAEWFCTPARIEREAAALEALAELAPAGTVPALVFQDLQQHLLGMEEVPEPHRNWKELLLAGTVRPDHVEQFGRLLGTIHRKSMERAAQLKIAFEDRSFFEALRLEPYYRYTAAQVPDAAPFLDRLIADTLALRMALVHGDYSPKNVLIHEGRLVLLDFEVVHFGDPAFDIGFSMAHFLSKAHHLSEHRADFAAAAADYWTAYGESAEYDRAAMSEVGPRAVRHSLACCLARVAGRSPLEYLTAAERSRQLAIVLELMKDAPTSIPDLVREFTSRLPCRSLNA